MGVEVGKPKPRPWAPEEIKILKRAYPAGGHKVTHKALEEAGFTDRSPRAVLEAAIRYGVKLLPEGERLTPTGLKALRALAEYGPTYTWEFPALVNAGA